MYSLKIGNKDNFEAICYKLACEFYKLAVCNQLYLYLYFRPGEVVIDSGYCKGFELVCQERIPIHYTIEQNTRWIYDHLKSCAIYPTE
jgi:hypothetical protein